MVCSPWRNGCAPQGCLCALVSLDASSEKGPARFSHLAQWDTQIPHITFLLPISGKCIYISHFLHIMVLSHCLSLTAAMQTIEEEELLLDD